MTVNANRKANFNLVIIDFLSFLFAGLTTWFSLNLTNLFEETRVFTMAEVFIFFFGLLGLFLIIIFFEKKYNSLPLNRNLCIIFSIIFLLNIFSVILIPSSVPVTIQIYNGGVVSNSFEVGLFDRVYSIFICLTYLMSAYLLVYVVPRKHTSVKPYSYASFILLIVCFVSIIYSIFTEPKGFATIFDNTLKDYATKSFFNNSNTYSLFLLISLYCSLLVHHFFKRWYLYFPVVFIFFALLTTKSRFTILLGILLLFGYLICRLIFTFKKHKKRNLIIISIFLFLLLLFITFLIIYFISGGIFFAPFFNKVISLFEYFGSATFDSRLVIYENINNLLITTNPITGVGFGIFNNIVYFFNSTSFVDVSSNSPHSGYYQILGQGGISLCIITVLLIIQFGLILRKIFKNNKEFSLLVILFLIAILSRMVVEAASPFSYSVPQLDGLLIMLFGISPCVSIYCSHKTSYEVENNNQVFSKNELIIDCIYIFAIPVGILVGFSLVFYNIFAVKFFAFLPLILLFIFASLLLFLYYKKYLKLFNLINVFLIIILNFLIIFVGFLFNQNYNFSFALILIIFSLVLSIALIYILYLKNKKYSSLISYLNNKLHFFDINN